MIYNDFDLKPGDEDATRKWGGTTRAESVAMLASRPNNAVASTGPVSDLQRDLQRVGILLGPAPKSARGLGGRGA